MILLRLTSAGGVRGIRAAGMAICRDGSGSALPCCQYSLQIRAAGCRFVFKIEDAMM
jgi:hypothetical protein